MMKLIQLLVLAALMKAAFFSTALAIPQFSLLTGKTCDNCHLVNQGGGLRNELGWYSMSDVSLLRPSTLGLQGAFDHLQESNTLFDDMLMFGADMRVQMARSHFSPDAERRVFGMQAQLYLAFRPTEWLTLEGSYNASQARYQNQQPAHGSVIIAPDRELPALRVGFFQPTFGLRHDDHTRLVRTLPGIPTPLIVPNYSEWGAELMYDAIKQVSLTAGVFRSSFITNNRFPDREGLPTLFIEDPNALQFVGRALWIPRFDDNFINTILGASVQISDQLTGINVFGGVGLTDNIALQLEYNTFRRANMLNTNLYAAEITWQATEGLFLYARGELGGTVFLLDDTGPEARQYVIGAMIFLLPYIELRPEYRIFDNDFLRSSRWAAQLHIFY